MCVFISYYAEQVFSGDFVYAKGLYVEIGYVVIFYLISLALCPMNNTYAK